MKPPRKPLRTLKPRLSPIAPRLKTPREIRDKRYSPDKQVRDWYHSARWKELREVVLVRDNYTCRQTGVILAGKYPAPSSAVVDHIIPHRGDEKLFWDEANLQAVSFEYHETTKKKLERSGDLA